MLAFDFCRLNNFLKILVFSIDWVRSWIAIWSSFFVMDGRLKRENRRIWSGPTVFLHRCCLKTRCDDVCARASFEKVVDIFWLYGARAFVWFRHQSSETYAREWLLMNVSVIVFMLTSQFQTSIWSLILEKNCTVV